MFSICVKETFSICVKKRSVFILVEAVPVASYISNVLVAANVPPPTDYLTTYTWCVLLVFG